MGKIITELLLLKRSANRAILALIAKFKNNLNAFLKNGFQIEKVMFVFGLLSSFDERKSKMKIGYRLFALATLMANLLRNLILVYLPDSIWDVYLGNIALASKKRKTFSKKQL